jgi:hypothetical protein
MKLKARAISLALGLVLLANICFGEIFIGPLAPEGGGVARVETADMGFFILPCGDVGDGGTGTALAVPLANDTRTWQFVIPFRLTVRVLQFFIIAGDGTTKSFGCGVYKDTVSAPLFETGAVLVPVAAPTTKYKVTLGAPYTLDPGAYIFAWTSDSTVVSLAGGSIGGNLETIFEDTVNQSGKAANAGSAGVLPATLGTISAVSIGTFPQVLIKP